MQMFMRQTSVYNSYEDFLNIGINRKDVKDPNTKFGSVGNFWIALQQKQL